MFKEMFQETDKRLQAAQATIADLQSQLAAAKAERDEQGQLKARLNRELNLLQNEHIKLHDKVKQESAHTKQVEIERDALQQQVAQLREAHRDFKVHLSHCNFGEHAGVCKYGREDECSVLTPAWEWIGRAIQRAEHLQTAHATLRGLVEEREYEIKRRIWQMHGSRMGHQLYGDDGRLDCNTCFRRYCDESLETVYGFEVYDANILCAKNATLPREGGAQEGKVEAPKPTTSCNRHSDCYAADERAKANGALSADHCHDDCCSECFGN